MNKKAVVTEFSLHFRVSEAMAEEAVEFVLQTMARGLRDDSKVTISNFGVFEKIPVQGRTYATPSGPVSKPSSERIRFRAAKNLKGFTQGENLKVAVCETRGRHGNGR